MVDPKIGEYMLLTYPGEHLDVLLPHDFESRSLLDGLVLQSSYLGSFQHLNGIGRFPTLWEGFESPTFRTLAYS